MENCFLYRGGMYFIKSNPTVAKVWLNNNREVLRIKILFVCLWRVKSGKNSK